MHSVRHSTAALVVVGNEILSGKIADVNSPFLAQQLRHLGVCLCRIEVVPDHVGEIAETIGRVRHRFDHVFTSGGVGPTHDDVTIEGIAASLGRGVLRDPVLEAELRLYYSDRINDALLRMALVPEGAVILTGEGIPIPVITVENITVLPGVPELFRRQFDSIRTRFQAAPFHCHRVYVNAWESDIVPVLDEVTRRFPDVDLGSYPRLETDLDYRVLLTVDGNEPEACQQVLAFLLERLPQECVRRFE